MSSQIIQDKHLGEQYIRVEHPSGLTMLLYPMPGFSTTYAMFSTQYGSVDTCFQAKEGGEQIRVPEGIAHYLEHKMFDTPQGNALQILSAQGASPNAFTGSAMTGYYFECTQRFADNLRSLLEFVSQPYFTQESVDKERGIIGQEIGMIQDDPEWRVYHNLMASLFAANPIRVSVAGSVESIAAITPQTLYDCHKAFYDPSNMALCVAGDVEPEEVCRIAREVLGERPGSTALRDYGPPESARAASPLCREEMAVSTPIFQLGFKGDAPEKGEAGMRQRLTAELALEMLLGNSTPLYARLYNQGLINANFSYGYEDCPGGAFLCAGGESPDPDQVRRAVLEEGARLAREGLDEKLWRRVKRGVYGGKVRSLGAFETLCIRQVQCFFSGVSLLDFPQVFDAITIEDARDLIGRWVTEERCALSVVEPRRETV